MPSTQERNWNGYRKHLRLFPRIGLSLDLSRVAFEAGMLRPTNPLVRRAVADMKKLEAGAIANPDEKRMVGHYWLRAPELAPTPTLQKEIRDTLAAIKEFAAAVHTKRIEGAKGPFKNVLVIGIGGSALGPQFVASALGQPGEEKLHPFFFDNTDPDGMDRVLKVIGTELGQTLCIVISKSGGTPETANGMKEAQAAYLQWRLDFAKHAVAITMENSALDEQAKRDQWLTRFPMWDWVGGRTSETSAVGLLPAKLQGLDIDELLRGARACDDVTRESDPARNPALLLALTWHTIGEGRGARDMVVIPYKDRLELFSRYLQQLVMESLGKEQDLDGKVVHQGLTVFGNKGSTDQHAYIQQLRDGLHNFFAVFIEVLQDRTRTDREPVVIKPRVESGDYLLGFLLGTRKALFENQRQSLTLTLDAVTPFHVGVLIALFERAVGFYASMININAYHQPGVQAGKKAADDVLALHTRLVSYLEGYLSARKQERLTVPQIAANLGTTDCETIFKLCEHLLANRRAGLRRPKHAAPGDGHYAVG